MLQAIGGILSSSFHDLQKNVASSLMKLFTTLDVALKHQGSIVMALNSWAENDHEQQVFYIVVILV